MTQRDKQLYNEWATVVTWTEGDFAKHITGLLTLCDRHPDSPSPTNGLKAILKNQLQIYRELESAWMTMRKTIPRFQASLLEAELKLKELGVEAPSEKPNSRRKK